MSQTRAGSLIEAGANLVVGYAINVCANMVILPAYGFTSLSWRTNLWIGVAYTGVSLIRQFFFRRLFNSIKAKWNTAHDYDTPH
jgi:hypothetical protein